MSWVDLAKESRELNYRSESQSPQEREPVDVFLKGMTNFGPEIKKDATGRPEKVTCSNGFSYSMRYDATGQPLEISFGSAGSLTRGSRNEWTLKTPQGESIKLPATVEVNDNGTVTVKTEYNNRLSSMQLSPDGIVRATSGENSFLCDV